MRQRLCNFDPDCDGLNASATARKYFCYPYDDHGVVGDASVVVVIVFGDGTR